MRLGIRKRINKFYISYILFWFKIRKILFGFENANVYIKSIDKSAMIPILRKNGASIGNDCDIETGLTFHNCTGYSYLTVGNNCHIGKNCFIDLRDRVTIGNNVVISMQTTFVTHIDMEKSPLRKSFPAAHAPIEVKDNCYIGACSCVLKGVTIHKNGFVSAGSVVTEDIPANTMVGGVPARLIKKLTNVE